MGDWKEILSMIGTVILMIAVFVGAYYASKFIGKNYQPRYGMSKNLSILESHSIGKDKALLIVKTADRAFLIGSTQHAFSLISELNPEDLVAETENMSVKKDFSSVLRSALAGKQKKQDEGDDR